MVREIIREKGLLAAICSKSCCTRQSIKQVARKIAPFLGYILIACLHCLFMGIILGLNLRTKTGKTGIIGQFFQYAKDDSLLVVMFGAFALVMTCLAWSLVLKPGVHPKMSLT